MDRKEVVLEFEPKFGVYLPDDSEIYRYYAAKLPNDPELSKKVVEAAKRCEKVDIDGTTIRIGEDLDGTLRVYTVNRDMTEELLEKAMQRLQKELENPTVKKVTLYVPVEA